MLGILKDVKFTGWHIVTLVGMVLATVITLVAMGQQLSALVAAGVTIASLLGVQLAQSAANNARTSEQLGQVKEVANGNYDKLRQEMARRDEAHQEELSRRDAQHTLERAAQAQQIMALTEKCVAYAAAMVPPDPKMTESADGLASVQ